MTPVEGCVLGVRVGLETSIVGAFAYWGIDTGGSTDSKILLAVAAPVIGFGFWGVVDFRQAGRLGEPLRLAQELSVSAAAALAMYATGHHGLAFGLAALSIVYHALVYLTGTRLLKPAKAGVEAKPGRTETSSAESARLD